MTSTPPLLICGRVGVKFHMEPFPTPVCRMAFVLDPDGNAICIHKRNATHH